MVYTKNKIANLFFILYHALTKNNHKIFIYNKINPELQLNLICYYTKY